MMNDGMMNTSNMIMGWGGMVFGPLIMIGFFSLIIFAIFMLVKWLSDAGSDSSRIDTNEPLNILKQRFAAGEIDKGEFEEKRRILN